MNQTGHRFRLFFSLIVLAMLAMPGSMAGQVRSSGEPLMNSADFSPEQVIYALSPLLRVESESVGAMQYNSLKKSLEYAVERPVDLSPLNNGQWVSSNGLQVWRAHLISPGALSIGLLFDRFHLSEGTRLFVYSADGRVIRGAFSADNNKEYGKLFVSPVPGDEIVVELQVEGNTRDFGDLRIGTLSHAVLPVPGLVKKDYPYLGTSQDCEVDVNCQDGNDWQQIKKSVCHIITPTNLCTGVLVNNTAYNGRQYLLTAEHCISSRYYAESSVFVFGYENSDCGQVDGNIDNSVSGATLIATGDSLDFSLLKLDEKIPTSYDVYYSGWDTRPAKFDSVVTLHHPNADAMKISVDFDSVEVPSTVPGDLTDYLIPSNLWIRQWDVGSTEGGSSGSPLFSKRKRLIGLLSGGLASCGDSIGYDVLKDRAIYSLEDNENDYYTSIGFAWDHYPEEGKQLKRWLDPLNTGAYSIGGLSPSTLNDQVRPAADNHISIYPNPADDRLVVELPVNSESGQSVFIYDTYGRLVLHHEITSERVFEIDIATLSPGIHFIRFTGQVSGATQKILVR